LRLQQDGCCCTPPTTRIFRQRPQNEAQGQKETQDGLVFVSRETQETEEKVTFDNLIQSIIAVAAVVGIVLQIRTNRSVEKVHKLTNSMKTELVDSVRKESTAKGHAAGVADERRNPQVPKRTKK
jgi:hypothetical protein